MSDIDNFVELNLKMENMRLQFAKFMSNGWKGDLYSGVGKDSDPTKMYELLEEILDKKDEYSKAIRNLENDGILDNVTTRGIIASGWDMIVNGWGSTAQTRKDKVLDILEKNKVMGDSKAQEELFNSLPSKWRKGETNAKTWFNNLNNGKYNNLCPQLHQYWVTTGAAESSGALAKYSEAAESTSSGNTIYEDAYKVGLEQTMKASDFNAALWDEATGGYIGKWQDANTIIDETEKLRQKIRDGSVKPSDIRKWVAGVGGVYAKEKISELVPDVAGGDGDPDWLRIAKDMTQEAINRTASETSDWLAERAMDEADKSAKDNEVSLTDIRNNIEKSGGSPAVVIVKDSDGKITVTGADKNGNATVATEPGVKTITTVTTDGQRATQSTKVEAGQNEIDAAPAPENITAETDPSSLSFDSDYNQEAVVVYTNIKYIRANTKDKWIHVSRNAYNVIVTVDENEGEARSGSVLIELSQDKESIIKTISLPVSQAAGGDDDDAKIDIKALPKFTKMRIELNFKSGNASYIINTDIPRSLTEREGTGRTELWATGSTTKNSKSMTFKTSGSGDFIYSYIHEGQQNWDVEITIDADSKVTGHVRWSGNATYEDVRDNTHTYNESISFNLKGGSMFAADMGEMGFNVIANNEKWSSLISDYNYTVSVDDNTHNVTGPTGTDYVFNIIFK